MSVHCLVIVEEHSSVVQDILALVSKLNRTALAQSYIQSPSDVNAAVLMLDSRKRTGDASLAGGIL